MNAAVIVAGGSAQRMGMDKLSIMLGEKSVLFRSLDAYLAHPDIQAIVLVVHGDRLAQVRLALDAMRPEKHVILAIGGKTRGESVLSGLRAAPSNAQIVCIHDAARPFVSARTITASIRSALKNGSGIASIPCTDTIKLASGDGEVVSSLNRDLLHAMQTPQTFRAKEILQAYIQAEAQAFEATDDAAVFQWAEHAVFLSEGDPDNIKITSPADMPRAKLLARMRGWIREEHRIGFGYDVHKLVPGRALILGGIEVPHETGLLGHSDADVLLHAIMDAMLGAAGLGDIGRHFPDTDGQYKDISSVVLLEKTRDIVLREGYTVSNIDCTIAAQRPKLQPYIPQMRACIAQTLGVDEGAINVKATTTEWLGFEGREEGMSAQCVASLWAI